MTFVTVGHSTDTLTDFIARLHGAKVGSVVDVRTLAGSTKFPHFNSEVLEVDLPEAGIEYRRIENLGGLRKRSHDVPPEVNGFWQNRSFHNYADYALSPDFVAGLTELIQLGKHNRVSEHDRVAVMCAEAVWWRCHRRIIADHLISRGYAVEHLMPQGKLAPATLTPGAVTEGDRVTYPA